MRAVFAAAALVLAGLLFRQLALLALALLLSVIFALFLAAIASRLERFGIPRAIGALVGLVGTLVFWVGALYLIVPLFVTQAQNLAADAPGLLSQAQRHIAELTHITTGDLAVQAQNALQGLIADPGRVLGTVLALGRSASEAIAAVVLICLTAYYMAVNPKPLQAGLLRLFPASHRPHVGIITERLRTVWLGWCRGLSVSMAVTGGLTYIAFVAVGLPFALLLAVLTAVMSVVPIFGAIISGVPAVLLALSISPGKAVVVALIYLVIQQIDAHLTSPLVMGRSVSLHPALIAFGVVIVGALFGFVGLVVAVPLLSLVAVLVEELWMKPLDEHKPRAAGLEPDRGAAAAKSSV
jgi:predicted PurR-regulated permease PerM